MRRHRLLLECAALWLGLATGPVLAGLWLDPSSATALVLALLLALLVCSRSGRADLRGRAALAVLAAGGIAGWLSAPLLGRGVRGLGASLGLAPVAPARFDDLPVAAWIAALLLAPWAEELLYRERMLDALEPLGLPVAVGVTSLAFALPHGSAWTILAALVCGPLLAAARYAARSTALCVGLHAGWNAFGVAHGVPARAVDLPSALGAAAFLGVGVAAARAPRSRRPGPLPALVALVLLVPSGGPRAEVLEVASELRLEPVAGGIPQASVAGGGVATVNGSAGGIALHTLSPAGGAVGSTIVPVTDPLVSIGGLVALGLDASLGAASLGPFRAPTAPLSGGLTRSTLPVAGSLRLCVVFTGCHLGPSFPLLERTSAGAVGVGVGGLVTAYPLSSAMLSLQGAPWTVGTATLPVTTSQGDRFTLSAAGAVHGPYSFTGSTALAGGEVRLVTPVRVASSGAVPRTGPFFGRLTLRFVPEPRSLLALPPAGLLLWLGGRRRRRGASMHHLPRSRGGRLLALLLSGHLGPLACVPPELLEPTSGAPAYQSPGLVAVPGGFVNAAGGNLLLVREVLSVDTPLGRQSLVAAYNGATGRWRFGHQIAYDGRSFVDGLGAVHDLEGIGDGAPVPGTVWDRVDADTLRTRGGLEYHFRPDGSLDHVRWATLEYPRITYAADGIGQCVGPLACSPLFAIASNAAGDPLAITEVRSGREARFAYDGSGRLVVARSPFDVDRGLPGARYEYAPGSTRVTAVVDADGARVEYAWQPGRRIGQVRRIGEGDPTHRFRYLGRNARDRYPTLHENPLGGVTAYAFDAQRRLLRVDRLPGSETTLLEWDGLRPSRVVDPAGVASRFTWVDDRLASWIRPSGNVVVYAAAPGGLNLERPTAPALSRVEDSLGVVEEREYDGSGRPVRVVRGGLVTTELGYTGAVVGSIAERGVEVSFPVFGIHGHWLEAVVPDGDVLRRVLDAVGDVTVPPPALAEGGTLGTTRDASRRIAAIQVAASDDEGRTGAPASVSVSRRSDGQILEVARPGGADHRIDYDALGRPVAIRERAGGAWRSLRIEYDAAGNQTVRERANGMREEYEYDAFGRMVRHRALRDGALEGELELTWSSGRLVARYDSVRGDTEVYHYDAAGRPASTAFSHGETIARGYDARDRLVRETFSVPGLGVVAEIGRDYDLADRPVRLVDRETGEVLVEDGREDERLAWTATANGLVRSYAYDAQGRLSAAATVDASGASVETTTVDRRAETGPPRLEIVSRTTTALASSEEHYWLPAGSSLAVPEQRIGKRLLRWRDGEGGELAFAWDPLSNPADTGAGDAFVYDAERARLLERRFPDGVSLGYAYDPAGFVTERDGVALTWTATGRLASFGEDTIAWDLSGRPISITRDGLTREFRLFGGRVESSLTTLGALDLGLVQVHLVTGERRYRHLDFRGNVSFVSDDSGAAVAHYRYGPHGIDAVWGEAGEAAAFERRPGLGPLVLMGERVLDPAIGRFLSPDPALQLLNQYAYTLGNPVWFEDRDGRRMTLRQALELGLVATEGVAAGVVTAAFIAGTPASTLAVTALAAITLTSFVVKAALQIDSVLSASAAPELTGAPRSRIPPKPPDPPDPPAPEGGEPAPRQIRVLEISIETAAPSCTPLGPLTGAGRTRWAAVVLLVALATLFGVGWHRRREGEVS